MSVPRGDESNASQRAAAPPVHLVLAVWAGFREGIPHRRPGVTRHYHRARAPAVEQGRNRVSGGDQETASAEQPNCAQGAVDFIISK